MGRAGERSTLARPGGEEKKEEQKRKEAKNGAEITGAFFPHGRNRAGNLSIMQTDSTTMARTIERLEKENWGDPGSGGSAVIERCLELRRKPISRFSVGDLRLMIGQDIGTRFLVPPALDILELHPFAEGDLYPGDLLACLLRLPTEFWLRREDQLTRTVAVAHRGLGMMERNPENSMFYRKMRNELRSFVWRHERITQNTVSSLNYEHN